ncbi:hypothetical protein [Flavobacterium adhaerens]|uniref:hypothetical protein n=1 Tax=Flavobacterium adhaerens TaxID=3149043 RepID=UPI0032B43C44
MNQTLEKVKNIEKNGYQIDFGNVFDHAFENYKKIALYAGLVLIIFFILLVILTTSTLIPFFGLTEMNTALSSEKLKFENLSESELMLLGGVSILTSCIFSPFFTAFLKMAHHGDRDQEFKISNLFSYYKSPYLKEIVVSTFLISTFNLTIGILMTFAKLDLSGTFLSYFISFITILTTPLIIFGRLSAIDTIKHSILIVLKQPIVLLGLVVVSIIGALVGFIGCCIGVVFTIPFVYSMNYAIYSAIIGIDSSLENELQETIP